MPKYQFDSFPNLAVVIHPLFNSWTELLCECVNQDNAVRDGCNMYLRVRVEGDYEDILQSIGFEKIEI
jgi:hypothetical protein